ncbi:MAG: protein kinase [Acidimicrobiaceae bacterium]|nr:protein kinase [Acidimicrobiaceae bacterium]
MGYCAPELLDNAHHSPACDTFSLGVLGYEIVSGRHPFAGPSLSGVLDAVRRGVYPPLADVVPGVPTRLAELITSAMSLDPAQRPHDLDRLSHAFLTVAHPNACEFPTRYCNAGQGCPTTRSLQTGPGTGTQSRRHVGSARSNPDQGQSGSSDLRVGWLSGR